MNSSTTNLLIALVVGLALGFLASRATGHHYQGVAQGDHFFVVDQSTGVYYFYNGRVMKIDPSKAHDIPER